VRHHVRRKIQRPNRARDEIRLYDRYARIGRSVPVIFGPEACEAIVRPIGDRNLCPVGRAAVKEHHARKIVGVAELNACTHPQKHCGHEHAGQLNPWFRLSHTQSHWLLVSAPRLMYPKVEFLASNAVILQRPSQNSMCSRIDATETGPRSLLYPGSQTYW
jgi:hypothetical protein